MNHRVLIQDPGAKDGPYLLGAISEAAHGARSGRGIFAFATAGGVDLLLNEPEVAATLRRGKLQIIVGIDAVTDRNALLRLRSRADVLSNLEPRVFWAPEHGFFHPKLCYFESRRRHTVIVGSGNLTPGGLRDNFEAFSVIDGSPSEMAPLRDQVAAFLDQCGDYIRPIGDEELARAAKNSGRETPPAFKTSAERPGPSQHVVDGMQRVLVAQIPKGGDRWRQANFDTASISGFFRGGSLDDRVRQHLFFNQVLPAGALAEAEVRPCVFTRSRNQRIELRALKGKDYPEKGPPIGVFLEMKRRHFTYLVLFPDDPGFSQVMGLVANVQSKIRRKTLSKIRRKTLTLAELLAAWPACPLALSLNEDDE